MGLSHYTTEPAEKRLARLAAAVGPLRRVLAAIAARLVATRAYERLCYARLADFARERPGVSARQLQELAPVHRALAGLPALERALVANALPWSKVRLVARVATAQDEDAWIARARALPTRRLEQEVRESARRAVCCAEYEWSGDYRTLPAYARDELGMSARKARALLRLERAGDACPELREAYRSGRLSWVKAQCLLPLLLLDLDGEWRPAWVDWAARVTVRRLAEDVERALLLRAGHHLAWHRCKFHPERTQDPIPPGERQLCAPDVDPEATQQLAWQVPRDVALLFTAVRETLRARLEAERSHPLTDGQVFDALLDGAVLAWSLREPGTRRPDPVIERDGYRCAIPGCTSRRNLQDHHIRFRSAGGSDDPGNRITLCAFHHLRCLHAGFLRVKGRAPDDLVFELGVSPGAPPLARYRSGDVAVSRNQVMPLLQAQRAA